MSKKDLRLMLVVVSVIMIAVGIFLYQRRVKNHCVDTAEKAYQSNNDISINQMGTIYNLCMKKEGF